MQRGYCHEYEINSLLDFIRGELKRQKISQTEAATFLGVSQGMLSRKLKYGSIDVKELKELRILLKIPSETIARFI